MSTLKLVVEAGPDAGRQFDIKPDGASIGRSTQNDIAIADAHADNNDAHAEAEEGGLLKKGAIGQDTQGRARRGRNPGDQASAQFPQMQANSVS